MIITISIGGEGETSSGYAELLEHSWVQSGQQGDLLRLMPDDPSSPPQPGHLLSFCESTLDWERHPYLDDIYQGYNLPGAVLQWLLNAPSPATVLLLAPGSIFCGALNKEVEAGGALAQKWSDHPVGDGPFNLPISCAPLQAYCVNRELKLAGIQLPLLIHSTDLLRMTPRWLELMGLIRESVLDDQGIRDNAVQIALNIAAAEYCIALEPTELHKVLLDPVIDSKAYDDRAAHYEKALVTGEHLANLWPRWMPGVRQATVCEQWYLELGSPPVLMSLNRSAGAVWKLCDGSHSLLEIVRKLQDESQLPAEQIMPDIVQTATALRAQGAIAIEIRD